MRQSLAEASAASPYAALSLNLKPVGVTCAFNLTEDIADIQGWRSLTNGIKLIEVLRNQTGFGLFGQNGERHVLSFTEKNFFLNQVQELLRVKARIKALTEKTVANGCTEAEAIAAAEMVGRLLERYTLSMDEIEVRQSQCVQVEVLLASKRRRPIDGTVPAIARFCDCKVWLTSADREEGGQPPGRGLRYIFFGFETDTALAAYLFSIINRAIATETAKFKASNPRLKALRLRSASSSFQHGLVARVAARLETMLKERDASVSGQSNTGTALIVVKHQVVEEAFRATDVRLVSQNALGSRVVTGAYQAGWQAGEQVNLGRPVRGAGQGRIA